MVKSTYGTGCFALLNTGRTPVASKNRLLTTIAYQLDGVRSYALEGSIFVAGAAVQWLRDGLRIVRSAEETGALAAAADPTQDVYLVPAFVGLGAPYWRADARGALFGLTRATGPHELAQAALESACFQTVDLLAAMKADWHSGRRLAEGLACRRRHGRVRLDHAASRRSDRRHLSIVRTSRRRPRLAPLISPACVQAFFPSRTVLQTCGSRSAGLRHRWMPLRGSESWRGGGPPSGGCCPETRMAKSAVLFPRLA